MPMHVQGLISNFIWLKKSLRIAIYICTQCMNMAIWADYETKTWQPIMCDQSGIQIEFSNDCSFTEKVI